jgi:dephospho-CoA kinase
VTQSPARVFALTGGIASGKSTVARMIEAEGVPVVDADQLARQVVRAGSEGLAAVVEAFGAAMLTADGELNRAKLGALIFAEPEARARLDALLHPLIQKAAERHFALHASQGHAWICYDVPLLFETGQVERYRPVIAVSVPREEQVRRAVARDGLTTEEVERRLDAQWPLERKVAAADFVIDNGADLNTTLGQVREVLERIRAGGG